MADIKRIYDRETKTTTFTVTGLSAAELALLRSSLYGFTMSTDKMGLSVIPFHPTTEEKALSTELYPVFKEACKRAAS